MSWLCTFGRFQQLQFPGGGLFMSQGWALGWGGVLLPRQRQRWDWGWRRRGGEARWREGREAGRAGAGLGRVSFPAVVWGSSA